MLCPMTSAALLPPQLLASHRCVCPFVPSYATQQHYIHALVTSAPIGLGPLFKAYAHSLDLLVDAAWKSVDTLIVSEWRLRARTRRAES